MPGNTRRRDGTETQRKRQGKLLDPQTGNAQTAKPFGFLGLRSILAQILRVAFHPDVRIHARVWMKVTCVATRAVEMSQRHNANGKANCWILRRQIADR